MYRYTYFETAVQKPAKTSFGNFPGFEQNPEKIAVCCFKTSKITGDNQTKIFHGFYTELTLRKNLPGGKKKNPKFCCIYLDLLMMPQKQAHMGAFKKSSQNGLNLR